MYLGNISNRFLRYFIINSKNFKITFIKKKQKKKTITYIFINSCNMRCFISTIGIKKAHLSLLHYFYFFDDIIGKIEFRLKNYNLIFVN